LLSVIRVDSRTGSDLGFIWTNLQQFVLRFMACGISKALVSNSDLSHLGASSYRYLTLCFGIPKKPKPVPSKSKCASVHVLDPKSGKFRKTAIVTKLMCPICRGDGRKEGKDCRACDGNGEISDN
jgi:hypothetical protein